MEWTRSQRSAVHVCVRRRGPRSVFRVSYCRIYGENERCATKDTKEHTTGYSSHYHNAASHSTPTHRKNRRAPGLQNRPGRGTNVTIWVPPRHPSHAPHPSSLIWHFQREETPHSSKKTIPVINDANQLIHHCHPRHHEQESPHRPIVRCISHPPPRTAST